MIEKQRHMDAEKVKQIKQYEHFVRKYSEEAKLLGDKLASSKTEYLSLSQRMDPKNKEQRERITNAYERKKKDMKEKLSSLERRQKHYEKKINELDINREFNKSDSRRSDYPESESDFSSISDLIRSEISESRLTLSSKASNNSLNSAYSKDDEFNEFKVQLTNQIAQLTESLETHQEKQKNMEVEIGRNLEELEKERAMRYSEQDYHKQRLQQLETELHDMSDLRQAELNLFRNDLEKQLEKLLYEHREQKNDLEDKIDKLELKIDELESRARNRLDDDGGSSGGHFLVEIIVKIAGFILFIISNIQPILEPFVKTKSRALASILIVILSAIIHHYALPLLI